MGKEGYSLVAAWKVVKNRRRHEDILRESLVLRAKLLELQRADINSKREKKKVRVKVPSWYIPTASCPQSLKVLMELPFDDKVGWEIFEKFVANGFRPDEPLNNAGETFLHLLLGSEPFQSYGARGVPFLLKLRQAYPHLISLRAEGKAPMDIYEHARFHITEVVKCLWEWERSSPEDFFHTTDHLSRRVYGFPEQILCPETARKANLRYGEKILLSLCIERKRRDLVQIVLSRPDFVRYPDKDRDVLPLAWGESRELFSDLLASGKFRIDEKVDQNRTALDVILAGTDEYAVWHELASVRKDLVSPEIRQGAFARALAGCTSVESFSKIMKAPFFKGVADIDLPVFPQRRTFLLEICRRIAQGSTADGPLLSHVLSRGADITRTDEEGNSAETLLRGTPWESSLYAKQPKVNGFRREGWSLLSRINGNFSYTLDFESQCIHIRDEANKTMQSYSFQSFGQSKLISEAVAAMKAMGGPVFGLDSGAALHITKSIINAQPRP